MATCNIEVNFNVQPGETIMYCPYFDNHYFRETRAHYHLNNCRRQYELEKKKLGEPMDVIICPLSYKHHIPAKDWAEHQSTCVHAGHREVATINQVTAEEEEAAKNLGPNCFMIPGTGEIIKMNTVKIESNNEWSRHDDWEVTNHRESTDTERPSRVPGVIGMSSGIPPKGKPVPQQAYAYSHMDRALKMGGQPIGLTKSEKKRWQAANLEKVKKEIREEEARELFRRQNNMDDAEANFPNYD